MFFDGREAVTGVSDGSRHGCSGGGLACRHFGNKRYSFGSLHRLLLGALLKMRSQSLSLRECTWGDWSGNVPWLTGAESVEPLS